MSVFITNYQMFIFEQKILIPVVIIVMFLNGKLDNRRNGGAVAQKFITTKKYKIGQMSPIDAYTYFERHIGKSLCVSTAN